MATMHLRNMGESISLIYDASIHLLNPRRGARDTNEIENENESKVKLDALTKTRDKARADLIEAYERANGRMYIIGDLEKAYTAACEGMPYRQA